MKIRPLHDRILATRVAAAGSGKSLENGTTLPLSVKNGDHVLIGKHAGSEVTSDGEDCIILREDDVLAIVEESGACVHGC